MLLQFPLLSCTHGIPSNRRRVGYRDDVESAHLKSFDRRLEVLQLIEIYARDCFYSIYHSAWSKTSNCNTHGLNSAL